MPRTHAHTSFLSQGPGPLRGLQTRSDPRQMSASMMTLVRLRGKYLIRVRTPPSVLSPPLSQSPTAGARLSHVMRAADALRNDPGFSSRQWTPPASLTDLRGGGRGPAQQPAERPSANSTALGINTPPALIFTTAEASQKPLRQSDAGPSLPLIPCLLIMPYPPVSTPPPPPGGTAFFETMIGA